MADKKKRIAQLVFKDLSDIILQELKEPVCKLACVNEVRLNADNTLATIYVSHLEPAKVPALVKYLSANRGAIRARLAKKLDIYKVPDLVFKKDELYEQGHRIDVLLEKAGDNKLHTIKDLKGKRKKR